MTPHSALLASRRRVLAGAAAAAATIAAPAIVRAQGGPLKVGVLLPRSGFEAGIGQDCQRGVDIAPAIFKSLGLPELTIMNGDTESNVDAARERAEKLISDGAQAWSAPSIPARRSAIAQVAEQKGIPLVINIAAAPAHHRAGLQIRLPEFPDRADDARATLSPIRWNCSHSPAPRQRRSSSCMSTIRSAPRCPRASAR